MPVFKTTWIFKSSFQSMGWSESWYVTATDKPTAHNASQSVAIRRLQALSNACTLVAIRTTGNIPPFTPNVMRQRDVLISFLNWPGQYNETGVASALGFTAAKVRFMNTTNEAFTVRELRGLPDTSWSNNSDKIASSLIAMMLPALVLGMQTNNFGFRHINRGSPPTYTYLAIQSGFYEGLTRRATGRPSYLPRGRKFAKRLHP